MEPMILAVCLAVLVSLGLAERVAARRARAAVPIRVHVNGTRGKSTVTRLIAAALREAGTATIAKVTGTTPRLVMTDGSEVPVRRFAPANVHEQAWLLRRARRAGARAVVAECMAVRPDLQWVSEREMVRATIGVITNVRRDHADVMGPALDDIARSLANSTPKGGVMVVGDARFADVFRGRCAALGTRLVVAGENALANGTQAGEWWREDVAVALAVTRELGIDDGTALAGMRKARPDPGAVAQGMAHVAGRTIGWIDATAANDPESLDLLLVSRPSLLAEAPAKAGARDDRVLIVYNHRDDRPDRLRMFAQFSQAFSRSPLILLTGDRPCLSLLAAVRRLCPPAHVRFVARSAVADAVEAAVRSRPVLDRVIFAGNTRGFVRPYG